MRSALYECVVRHARTTPVEHRFDYRVFTFALDVDEIDSIAKRIPIFSRNRFNVFSFFDADHIDGGFGDLRGNIVSLLAERGVKERIGRILLITNVRILGYVFNPVSFFFCFDGDDQPLAVIAEVNNTFGETKPYVLSAVELRDGRFDGTRPKNFYISPFVALDSELRLRLDVPGEQLSIAIADRHDGEHVLTATMSGEKVPLTTARLLWFSIKYPLLTLKIIAAIHWQALRLWLKGVPWHRKSANPELQTGVVPKRRPVTSADLQPTRQGAHV